MENKSQNLNMSNDDDDSDSSYEEEEEPKLKYERLCGDLSGILQRDSLNAIASNGKVSWITLYRWVAMNDFNFSFLIVVHLLPHPN